MLALLAAPASAGAPDDPAVSPDGTSTEIDGADATGPSRPTDAAAPPEVSGGAADAPAGDPIPFVGQVFDLPPQHLAALFDTPPEPSLKAVQAHMEANDLQAAAWEADRVAEDKRWGRDRDAAFMVQGMLHREAGRHNLASAAFTKVRGGKGPLAPWGAYFEAEQDLARGRYWVAARECEAYRKDWPEGRHAEDCHRMIAVAYAKAGSWAKAREIATEYDELHQNAPITEQIELTLTLGALSENPERMIPRLQEHATEFTAPLTGRVAVETLASLRAQGFEEAVLPTGLDARKARAYSLRNTKQTADAWNAFSGLIMDAEDDPALEDWIGTEAETFGWRTRNWDFLAEYYAAKYAEKPDPEAAWDQYRVLTRGGRFAEAVEIANTLGVKHKASSHWSRKQEEIARTHMLARDYAGARELFDEVARRGGWTGLRGRYYAAFAGVMAADDDADTLARLTKIVETDGTYALESRYWRAAVYERLEKPELAKADREAVVALDPDSWYGALARQTLQSGVEGLDRRDGTWPAEPTLPPPVLTGTPPSLFGSAIPAGRNAAIGAFREGPAGFGLLTWSPEQQRPVAPPTSLVVSRNPELPPRSYVPGVMFPKEAIERDFRKYAERHATAWPELEAAYDLARAGLYDLSGPLFSAIYEEWRAAYRFGNNKKHASARAMKLDAEGWRGLFDYVRDHHHTARFNYSTWETIEDPELAREARKIGYPLAHDRFVWTHARESGVDPYLVLGLMRQESTYNSIARSPVGASGAMQIMPRTGHLVADLQHDVHFTAGDLEDPTVAIEYGIRYLGLLMDRFDDAYPLAIASYNGGPFNVSSWLAGTGTDMPMDAFVEHIPFRETRDYVKKVSAGYSAYLTLYAPENSVLAPPATPRGDHPEIVDF
ncbi:MAG: lytic transglycosylase domain-containing protein [Myxococcota bacterium]